MAAEAKYDMTVYPIQMAVRSASDGARVHMVTFPSCTCADFINRRGQLTEDGTAITVCKHIREALDRVGGWHGQSEPESKPKVYPDVSRSRVRTICADLQISPLLVADALTRANEGQPAHVAKTPSRPGVKLETSGSRFTVTVY